VDGAIDKERDRRARDSILCKRDDPVSRIRLKCLSFEIEDRVSREKRPRAVFLYMK